MISLAVVQAVKILWEVVVGLGWWWIPIVIVVGVISFFFWACGTGDDFTN